MILKISNVFLDVLLYPFVKFREPKFMSKITTEPIENCNGRQIESHGITTKECDTELDSALKIRSDK